MLTDRQIQAFRSNGFLLLENLFNEEETGLMNEELAVVSKMDSEKKILEKNGGMRSFFAAHEEGDILNKATKVKKLVHPVKQLLASDVYLHQTKINSKHALTGDWWEWHQDFPYWHFEDGMPQPRVLTVMIFLDEANEFNGPMLLVPGSNRAGLVDPEANDIDAEVNNEWFNNYQASKTYMSNVTSNLKYTLKKETLASWITRNKIYPAKGPVGTVLLFDGLVFHSSSNNLSPWNRNAYLITYNSTDNTLQDVESPRPNFLANRDFTPITEVIDNLA
jgi:ectoine hydroxylase